MMSPTPAHPAFVAFTEVQTHVQELRPPRRLGGTLGARGALRTLLARDDVHRIAEADGPEAADSAQTAGMPGGTRWSVRPRDGLWRNPDFLWLWCARTVSVFGNEVTFIALPLTAVLFLDASPTQMGLLRSAGFAPQLLFGLLAGVWVDRLSRRPLLVGADLGRAALLTLVPLLGALALLRIELLYAVSFAVGTLTVLYVVALQSFLPSLARGPHLVEANAKLQTSGAVARVAGPGLGGILVQAVGAPLAIVLDAVSFVVSAASTAAISAREAPPPPREHSARVLSEIGEGLRFLFGNRLLWATTAALATFNLFFNMQQAVLLLALVRDAALSPSVIGIALGVGSAGGLLGAFLAGRPPRYGFGPTLVVAFLVGGIAGLLVSLAGVLGGAWAVPLLVAGQALNGISYPVYAVALTSLRQVLTPERLRGRATASFTTVAWGVLPIGSLAGGLLGDAFGLRAVLLASGVGMAASFLWLLCARLAQLRDIPQTSESP